MKFLITPFCAFLLMLFPLNGQSSTSCKCRNNASLTPEFIIEHLKSPVKKKVIIDSDTYNEIDDQYAIAYALGSPNIDVLGINAEIFLNSRCKSYADGMEKSYNEIQHVLQVTGLTGKYPVFRGPTQRFSDKNSDGKIIDTPAARNIIKIAKSTKGPIYVLCLGAITNAVSAITIDPSIKNKIVIVWLGTNFDDWTDQGEFNLQQDYTAAQMLVNSGVPLVLMPAQGLNNKGSMVLKTVLKDFDDIKGDSRCAQFFRHDLPRSMEDPTVDGWYHILWDLSAPGLIANPEAYTLSIEPSPVLTDNCQVVKDSTRPKIIWMKHVQRDAIINDAFNRISELSARSTYK